jgi:hypothetical protein
MIGSSHSNGSSVLFLKLLGVVGMFFSWMTVFRPRMKVYWGRGANRLLMSQTSRLAFAIAVTGWCLGVFGFDYRLAVGVFLLGWATAVGSARQDEARHVATTGVPLRNPAKPEDTWLALCVMDGIFLWIVSYATIRDHFHPPVTDEQKSVHVLGMVLQIAFTIGAVVLYWTRPRKTSL